MSEHSPAPLPPLPAEVLPDGVRSRFADGVNGLRIHVLEAGHGDPARPCVLLLHGFPELAYSWRKVMPLLADAGYHVLAPDVRGYGRTTGWDVHAESGRAAFGMLTSVIDAIGVLAWAGRRQAAVVGHDYGSSLAGWCAIARPDIFPAVAMMSAPFGGAPRLRVGGESGAAAGGAGSSRAAARADIHAELAALDRPRKIYTRYYSGDAANGDMMNAPQGLAAFLRAYYYSKSADWPGNQPSRLDSYTAAELATMPTYYIMDRDATMPETVAAYVSGSGGAGPASWLSDAELAVYAQEFGRTTFRGGLQWYRRGTAGLDAPALDLLAGRVIAQPSTFIAGAADWGVYQNPGALERMRDAACTAMRGIHLIDGAGHWVQQEQPEATAAALVAFLRQDYNPAMP